MLYSCGNSYWRLIRWNVVPGSKFTTKFTLECNLHALFSNNYQSDRIAPNNSTWEFLNVLGHSIPRSFLIHDETILCFAPLSIFPFPASFGIFSATRRSNRLIRFTSHYWIYEWICDLTIRLSTSVTIDTRLNHPLKIQRPRRLIQFYFSRTEEA